MESVTLGAYRLVRRIGRGGSGDVYEAVDTRLNRQVAVKLLSARLPEKLQHEARVMSSLEHPNVVTVHGIEEVDGRSFIVMELVRGETLAEKLKRGRLDRTRALSYGCQIAEALAAAHAVGIVHRDVKPTNVIVREDGSVKILDFGLAGGADEIREGGTLDYASPEQLRGERLDARSDIYSLGVVLREMLAARRWPSELRRVVARTLQDDPARRFQSAADLRVALVEVLEEHEASSHWPGIVLAVGALVTLGVVLWVADLGEPPLLTVTTLTSFTGGERAPVLSPDGHRVAFAGRADDETHSDIFVQLVSGGEPLRVTSSGADESSPAWSPDGQRIAFLRELSGVRRQVLTVSALGGEPAVIGEVDSSWSSLAWSPDGASLAVNVVLGEAADKGFAREGLALMSVETGAVELLTAPSGSFLFDVRPRFSPDGGRLAFERVSSYGGEGLVIGVLSLADGSLRELAAEGWIGRGLDWTSDGSALVVADRGRLVRRSLSGGVLRDLLPGETRAARPAIARAGTRLVYERDVTDWDIVSSDGVAWVSSTFRDATPRFSPNGSAVAFVSDRTGSEQIWVLDLETHRERQLTTDGRNDNPSWSPDGTRIAYMCGTEDPDICVVDVEGGFPDAVVSGSTYEGLPSWSRDGRWIYFGSDRAGANREEIWRVASSGGDPHRVTDGGGSEVMESHDGDSVFYVIHGQRKPGIWRMRFGGGEPIRVVEDIVPANGWTLTAEGLYFVRRHTRERFTIERLDLASERLESVTELSGFPNFGGIDVSPDEAVVLYGRVMRSGTDVMLVESTRPF